MESEYDPPARQLFKTPEILCRNCKYYLASLNCDSCSLPTCLNCALSNFFIHKTKPVQVLLKRCPTCNVENKFPVIKHFE